MKKITFLSIFLLSIFIFQSCKKDNPEPVDPNVLIDPSDANALSEVLIMPNNTQENNGTPPASSNSANAPTVNNSNDLILSSNGSTAPLNFSYDNINGNLGGCYVQVDGAGNFFTVPYTTTSGNSGQLQLPIGIPTNVDAGDFCLNFCVYDDNGLVSNVVNSCVSVLRLGTGAIQISLSWENETDQDLYVTDPLGEIISFENENSSSGGQLDRDDIDGYGPENIYWEENAPDGVYKVEVNDFDETSFPNTFYITVSGFGTSRNFTGTTSNGSTANVVSFTKSGENITF